MLLLFREMIGTKCDEKKLRLMLVKSIADFIKLFDVPVDKDNVTIYGNAPIYDFPEKI